ncbi:hypothetical protein CYMTET_13614 [Cymbomonas tetramitiformis]|uniref:Protein kinase domain-containing protein n=1 Tax=Cymbomonas tetramitiformis TaxID=36881 RepID=A0AAE0LB77_9CHLO|nr:hypothetical protein CYMTET_13614 [Cymbomonas tetramitiformis]
MHQKTNCKLIEAIKAVEIVSYGECQQADSWGHHEDQVKSTHTDSRRTGMRASSMRITLPILVLFGMCTLGNFVGCLGQERVYTLAVGLYYSPYDFIGQPDVSASNPALPIEGWSNEVALLVCEKAGVKCNLVFDDYDYCWGRYVTKDQDASLQGLDNKTWKVYAGANLGSAFQDGGEVLDVQYGGEGIMSGWYDACVGWTHTYLRQNTVRFGHSITAVQGGGILMLKTKIDELGGLDAAKAHNLTGMKVGYIENWATNPGALAYVQNPYCSGDAAPESCSGQGFSGYMTDGYGGDDPEATVKMLIDGDVDAVWFYDSMVEDRSGVGSSDTTYWTSPNGYDVYEWVHVGITDYAANGTAVFGRYDNGFLDIWDAALPAAIADSRYGELCDKYGMSNCLTGNSNNTEVPSVTEETVYTLAVGLYYSPYDFIGQPDVSASNPALPIEGWSNEVALLVCEKAGVKCNLVFDDYDYCWGRYVTKDQDVSLQGLDNKTWKVYAGANLGSAFQDGGEVLDVQYGGEGIMSGWYDACVGWTHTYLRQNTVRFGHSITAVQGGGILMLKTKIDELGGLDAAKAHNLTGMKVGYIENWATNPGALAYVQNPYCSGDAAPESCSGQGFSGYMTDGYGGDDPEATVKMLIDGDVDAVWFYDSMVEDRSGVGSSDTTYWTSPNGYDVYEWVHVGITDYAANGTAVFGRYDNGFLDIWDAALPAAIADSRYGELCDKYGMSNCLTGNSNNTEVPSVTEETVYTLAVGLYYSPYDFIGQPDVSASNPALPIEGWSNEVALLVCEKAGVKCNLVFDDYDYCWGRYVTKDQDVSLQGLDNKTWKVYAGANLGSAFQDGGEVLDVQYGGEGIMSGWYDACVGWTHTYLRQNTVRFGHSITAVQGGGILMLKTKIDELGGLEAAKAHNLTGMKVGYIENWATNPGALAYVQNPYCSGDAAPESCSGQGFSGYMTDGYGGDDPEATVKMLIDGDVDAVWFYDSMVEDRSGVGSSDTTYWTSPYGYDYYDWVHVGITDYAANGTAVFGRYDNGFLDIWDAALPGVLEAPEYWELCDKYGMPNCITSPTTSPTGSPTTSPTGSPTTSSPITLSPTSGDSGDDDDTALIEWVDEYERLVQKIQGLVPMCGEDSFARSTDYSDPDLCKQKCDSMDDGCNVIYFYGSSASTPECGGKACPDCFYYEDAEGEIAYSDGCELATNGGTGFDIFTKGAAPSPPPGATCSCITTCITTEDSPPWCQVASDDSCSDASNYYDFGGNYYSYKACETANAPPPSPHLPPPAAQPYQPPFPAHPPYPHPPPPLSPRPPPPSPCPPPRLHPPHHPHRLLVLQRQVRPHPPPTAISITTAALATTFVAPTTCLITSSIAVATTAIPSSPPPPSPLPPPLPSPLSTVSPPPPLAEDPASYIVTFTITFHQYPFKDYLVDPSAFQAAHVEALLTSVSGEDEVVEFLEAASGSTLTSSRVIYPPEVAASPDFDCDSSSTTSCGIFLATLTTNPAALFASSIFFADFLDEVSVSGVTTTHLGASSVVISPPPPSSPPPPAASDSSEGDGEGGSASPLPAVLGALGGVALVAAVAAACYHYYRSSGGDSEEGLKMPPLPGCLRICVRDGPDATSKEPIEVVLESNPTFSTMASVHTGQDAAAEGAGDRGADDVATSMAMAAGPRGSGTRAALLMLRSQGEAPTHGSGGSMRRSSASDMFDDDSEEDDITEGGRVQALTAEVGDSTPQGCGGLQEYTVAEVCQLLEWLGISSVEFEAQEVSGALLCGLTAEDLVDDLELTSAQAEAVLQAVQEGGHAEGRLTRVSGRGSIVAKRGAAASLEGVRTEAEDSDCEEAGKLKGEDENDEEEGARKAMAAAAELRASGAVARALSREVGAVAGTMALGPTRAEQLSTVVKLLQGSREPVRERYELERSEGQRQGASGVVSFAVDVINGARVAIKLFLDSEDFHAELANCRRCRSAFVVRVLDVHPPPPPSLAQGEGEAALLRYGHLVLERGEHSLAEFLQRRPSLNAVRKLGIMHDVFAALRFMHDEARVVHGDIKPANIVKFAAEDVWKLVDMATASTIGEETRVEYTLRYAAPEVVRRALEGDEVAAREPAADLWSAGVMMYELYTGRRLFGEKEADEEVVVQLCGAEELSLKGLVACETGAGRLIRDKLLVKEPSERWPAEKVLSSSFFKRMEDTTKMSNSSRELAKDVRRLSVTVEETARLAAVSVSEMQAGSLMVEVQLTETSPKQQSCILSEHERAGPVFNLVPQCHYQLELTIFREGTRLANPVKAVVGAVFHTADGMPLPLGLLPAPATNAPRLPNGLAFVGTWVPATCKSTLLMTKTKWPHTREAALELQLELHDLPGKPVTIRQGLHFVVHKKDGSKLRALRAYEWAKQEYLNLTPETRGAIRGVVFAVETAAGVLM